MYITADLLRLVVVKYMRNATCRELMSGREMRKALSVNFRSLKWALIELIGDDDDEAVVQDPSTVTL